MWPPADLVTFTEEILDRKLHFLCSVTDIMWRIIVWNLPLIIKDYSIIKGVIAKIKLNAAIKPSPSPPLKAPD